eukprot:7244637-Prymnesium_polylepis.1
MRRGATRCRRGLGVACSSSKSWRRCSWGAPMLPSSAAMTWSAHAATSCSAMSRSSSCSIESSS